MFIRSQFISRLVGTTLAAALIIGLAVSAQAEPESGTITAGHLKVAMAATYPPFESVQNGKIVGSDPDFGTLLAKQLGMSVSFEDAKFSTLILGLSARRYDAIISGMYITPERTAQASAVPYAQTSSAILVTAASGLSPKKPEDLCGMHVGIVSGTVYLPKLRDLSSSYCKSSGKGEINISEYPTTAEAIQAMLSNNVQAGMQVANTAYTLAAKSNGRIVVSSTDLIYPQVIGIYVRKDNIALIQAITKGIEGMKQSGELDKWLKDNHLFMAPASAG
ncbi:ABC-type amino acid transport/signal transduction system, periplasmic component/domain [Paraburkholderia caribensis MBA4]|uniref:ABC-type amino acid transport/signal transduction system, periplasmic component/domain n=1 Tax=Paraburkholderia caribensis MBA4 TaxID=1323664 RepID=A0A0P0RIF1_9BURK|nr:transporter substrate-binding domain-containing protein [Paraburkholderia caribensis]ALL68523.1 ABC-type amino acid transport/signal transduction system, periplasmic component/domain [Paraburkholderia caribensis MBA4]